MSRITLYDYQVPHYQRLENILCNNISALDTSPTGSGKTITALKFAQDYELTICVICPSVVVNNWKKYAELYGVEVLSILSYDTLRGRKGKTNNKLVTIHEGKYHPTRSFIAATERGLLLIYDEVHKLMNDTQQNRAAHCLTNTLRREGDSSRILALSASPCVKTGNSFPLLKVLGFSLSPFLYNYVPATKIYNTKGYGYEEIVKTCQVLNPSQTAEILLQTVLDTRTAPNICSRFFLEVILPKIRSFTPSPPHSTLFDGKLGLYKFPEQDVRELRRAYGDIVVNVDENGFLRGNITSPCRRISMAYVKTLARIARRDIKRGKKVVIFAEYHDTVEALERRLEDLSPLFLNGKVKKEERDKIVEKFQENNSDYSLLIVNPKVGGIGIELDDKTGSFPRRAYIIPSYYFIDILQAVGRICRANTKSKAEVRIVESDEFPENTKILTSIISKSSMLKKVTGREKDLLPGDYPIVYEEEDN